MENYKIVETDNFDGDYPNESFVNLPISTKENMKKIADSINSIFCNSDYSTRFWKVVKSDYVLCRGFEP